MTHRPRGSGRSRRGDDPLVHRLPEADVPTRIAHDPLPWGTRPAVADGARRADEAGESDEAPGGGWTRPADRLAADDDPWRGGS